MPDIKENDNQLDLNAENEHIKTDIDRAKKRAFYLMLVSGFILLCASGAAVLTYYFTTAQFDGQNDRLKALSMNLAQDSSQAGDSGKVRRLVDGVLVEPGQENLYPIAVMMDNHPDARPQAGLADANLVYEAWVEGATTRFMAIFASGDEIDEIGPVRSARPYFIDWSREFSSVYTHCGGSPDALAELIKDNVNDLNEFYNGQYFWRSSDKEAPHNVMTSSEKLYGYLEGENLQPADYFSWEYKADSPPVDASSSDITIPDFGASWKYSREKNSYLRYQNGRAYQDKQGNQIIAKNLAIMEVPSQVLDELLRLELETSGEGKAVVCLDGACQEGTWKKNNPAARTRFYYVHGDEVAFNAGTTWIEVVNPGQTVEY